MSSTSFIRVSYGIARLVLVGNFCYNGTPYYGTMLGATRRYGPLPGPSASASAFALLHLLGLRGLVEPYVDVGVLLPAILLIRVVVSGTFLYGFVASPAGLLRHLLELFPGLVPAFVVLFLVFPWLTPALLLLDVVADTLARVFLELVCRDDGQRALGDGVV